jgi:hypothetical protein
MEENKMLKMSLKVFLLPLLIILFYGLVGNADAAEYVGEKKCKICHIKQYKSWKKTGMATSFESLKPGIKAEEKKKAGLDPDKDYATDSGCLKCHTTGYGKPGGFISLAETPKLINVQCEGCHGPGGAFWKVMKDRNFKSADASAAGLILPNENENNCMECHGSESPFNEKVDPKYKFDIKDRLGRTHEHFPLKFEH